MRCRPRTAEARGSRTETARAVGGATIDAWTAGLFAGYVAAIAGWWLLRRAFPALWEPLPPYRFVHPWREVGLVFLAAVLLLFLGQLYVRGIRLPTEGLLGPLAESLNQLWIFSPVLLLPVLRRQPATTALLRPDRPGRRILIGCCIAALALAVHVAVRRGMGEEVRLLPAVFLYQNLDEAVQVLLEDLVVAILLVRLAAAVGPRATIALVALLFAAGHIPTMLAQGATLAEIAGLARDVALGVLVLGTVLRSGDILWFWPVHFVMDMTQFPRIMGTE